MVNGVWLQPYVVDQMGLPGPVQRLRRTGRLTLTLLGPGPVGSYAMEADVTATNGNRRISIAIGLGAEPTVAEAILSSIRPTS
ncbi:MAG: hypothetical protein FWC87_05345 [Acidimicrobiaceae bacterium]|nr:hypothetical protein [Acidimicrobiaceae bacterium]